MSQLKKPIFIVGCPRSGTTLLASRLNQHSQIAVTPETHFFTIMNDPILSKTKYSLSIKGIKNFLYKSRLQDFQISYSDFQERFFNTEMNYIDIFDTCVNLFLEDKNKLYWCEKTPRHLKYIKNILHHYPNAKIICILRDGRDVALSLSEAPWHERNIATSSLEWNEYANYFLKAKSNLSVDNFFYIKYEDMILNPESQFKSICNFLGINFETNLLFTPSVRPDLFPEWEKEWKSNIMKPFDHKKVNGWRFKASPYKIGVMQSIMKNYLELLGYYKANLNLSDYEKMKIYLSVVAGKTIRPFFDFVGRYSRFRNKIYHPF